MSTTPETYDLLILGSGEAGKTIAWSMATAGKKTALIERRYIGGSCPNIACLPSKNVVHSAKVAHYASQAAAFGLPEAHSPINMEIVRQRKRAMVQGLVEMHETRFKQSGAELILGSGTFIAPKTLAVTLNDGTQRTLTAENIVISTGSRATIAPIPGLAEAQPLTHIELLEIAEIPRHLIILGGGYIGLEFAQAMRRFGSAVTIVERNADLIHNEDPDTIETLTEILRHEGVKVVTNAVISHVTGTSGQSVTVSLTEDGFPIELQGSHILVAAGRTPNNDNIGLDLTGVHLTPSGHIRVDENLRTTAPGIFAVGDCAGSPHFTHIAYDDNRIVRAALTGGTRSTKNRQIPFTLFTDPEFAHVGLREREAKAQSIPYRLAKLPYKAVLRSRTMDESTGFVKALIAPDDTILGFTAVGVTSAEMLPAVQLVMANKLPYTALRDLIITHPTITEGLVYLFSAVPANR